MTRNVAPGSHLENASLQAAYQRIRDIEIFMNFIEPHPELDNYSEPIRFGVDSRNQLRIDLFK